MPSPQLKLWNTILAIDPGTSKIGYALLDSNQNAIEKGIIRDLSKLDDAVRDIIKKFKPEIIVIGNGTGSDGICERIKPVARGLQIVVVDESGTTEEARKRYWSKIKPGIRTFKMIAYILGLIKIELDDEVAVGIGLRYLNLKESA